MIRRPWPRAGSSAMASSTRRPCKQNALPSTRPSLIQKMMRRLSSLPCAPPSPARLRRQILAPPPFPPSSRNRTASLLTHPHTEETNNSTHQPAPVIRLNKIAKVFGRFAALRDITCDLHAATLYVIVGETGAGKSTLLRILAGLSTSTSGTVEISGSTDVRSVSEQIGYMGHASLIYDEMTGVENLAYFAALYAIKDAARCHEALASVGLDPKLMNPARNYSQGMRQRLSLARATVHDPQIILLDEPFSNVDPDSSAKITERLKSLARAGKTIVVVTHQPALLAGAADEFLTISGGRIVAREVNEAAQAAQISAKRSGLRSATDSALVTLNLLKDLRLEWRAKDP